MKKSILASTVIMSAFVLSACNSSSSKSDEQKNNVVIKTVGVTTEKINCIGSLTSKVKFENGTIEDQQDDSLTTFVRTTTVSADGKTHKTIGSGESSFTLTTSGSEPFKMAYSYTSETEFAKTEIEKGTFKEVGQYKMVKTGKDGFQFRLSDGVMSSTKTTESKFENVYKIDGNKKIAISEKADGQDLAMHDYETTIEVNGNIKTETTILKTPFVENINNIEFTTEKDVQICTFETVQ